MRIGVLIGLLAVVSISTAGWLFYRWKTAAPAYSDLRIAQDVRVPFRFEANEIVVPARIGGRTVPMLFDTNTDPFAIDLPLARAVGALSGKEADDVEGGGSDHTRSFDATIPSVALKSIERTGVPAMAVNLAPLARHHHPPVQGVIGLSFLSGSRFTIDYANRTITFLHAVPPITENAITLPFVVAGRGPSEGCIIVPAGISINGKNVVAAIDTGSEGSVSFSPRGVEHAGLTSEASHGAAAGARGYNGAIAAHRGTLGSVTIGNVTLHDVEARFWPAGSGYDDAAWDANVGNELLQHFLVTIDYPARRIILEPLGKPPEAS